MIRHLDQLLRDLFVTSMVELGDESQVGFRPPDDDWISSDFPGAVARSRRMLSRTHRLRENRVVRSERGPARVNGGAVSEPCPSPDCHSLITGV